MIDRLETRPLRFLSFIEVSSADQFMKELRNFDGEAKWYKHQERVFITSSMTESYQFPFGSDWDYAYSDELDCIDWNKMGLGLPTELREING